MGWQKHKFAIKDKVKTSGAASCSTQIKFAVPAGQNEEFKYVVV